MLFADSHRSKIAATKLTAWFHFPSLSLLHLMKPFLLASSLAKNNSTLIPAASPSPTVPGPHLVKWDCGFFLEEKKLIQTSSWESEKKLIPRNIQEMFSSARILQKLARKSRIIIQVMVTCSIFSYKRLNMNWMPHFLQFSFDSEIPCRELQVHGMWDHRWWCMYRPLALA